MTLQRTDEVLTFTKEHYIDKTQELKKGIETFPSIFIEGGSGIRENSCCKYAYEGTEGHRFCPFSYGQGKG